MKILHTADTHIREQGDERWQAFSEIIQLAESEKIDVLAISGDLFDSDVNANRLRPKFREFFSDTRFETILIAGNHDANAYPAEIFIGEHLTIIRDHMTPAKINGVDFWGFPFSDLKSLEVLQRLREMDAAIGGAGTNVLLFHGELLDISGEWENYGSEGLRRYLPVKLEYFNSLKWDYILAGHFHTHFHVNQFDKSKYFVYPGSPVSITKKELGARQVNLFEVGKPPQGRQLNTPYFEALEIKLDPFSEMDIKQTIAERLKKIPAHARILVSVGGYFDRAKIGMSEQELQNEIQRRIGDRAESMQLEFRDIHEVLADDLYKTFIAKLEKIKADNPEKEKIRELTLRAMMEL